MVKALARSFRPPVHPVVMSHSIFSVSKCVAVGDCVEDGSVSELIVVAPELPTQAQQIDHGLPAARSEAVEQVDDDRVV